MSIQKIVSSVWILAATFSVAQQKENPINICKDCGKFDIAKVTFSEKTSDLTAKTEIWKSVIVNHNNDLKFEEEVTKNDTVKLYKYSFANGRNLNLGKNYFNYNQQFDFSQFIILTDAKNRFCALESTISYDGEFAEVNKFINHLKVSFKGFKLIKNKIYGDLNVHQWFTDDKIIQLVTDAKEGTAEYGESGNVTKIKSTYVKLNIYSRFFIENSINKMVEHDTNFALFDERYFIKN